MNLFQLFNAYFMPQQLLTESHSFLLNDCVIADFGFVKGNDSVLFSMVQKNWSLLKVLQLKIREQMTTEANNPAQSMLTSQSIYQSHCTSLTETADKNPRLRSLSTACLSPILDLLLDISIHNTHTLFNLIQRIEFIVNAINIHVFDVIPACCRHSFVDGDWTDWGMQQLYPCAVVHRRVRQLEEVQKARRSIPQSMEPDQRKFRMLGQQSQGLIDFSFDHTERFHLDIIILMY